MMIVLNNVAIIFRHQHWFCKIVLVLVCSIAGIINVCLIFFFSGLQFRGFFLTLCSCFADGNFMMRMEVTSAKTWYLVSVIRKYGEQGGSRKQLNMGHNI